MSKPVYQKNWMNGWPQMMFGLIVNTTKTDARKQTAPAGRFRILQGQPLWKHICIQKYIKICIPDTSKLIPNRGRYESIPLKDVGLRL